MQRDLFRCFDYSVISSTLFYATNGLCIKNFVELVKSIVWVLGMSWLFPLLLNYFFSKNYFNSTFRKLIFFHFERTFNKYSFKMLKGRYRIIRFLFVTIVFTNLWGICPYIFSVTSHIIFTFSLGFFICFLIACSDLSLNFMSTFSGLFIQCPRFLLPLLTFIEFLSLFIRPITLSLRLGIKMTTGHVILGLISNVGIASMVSWRMVSFLVVLSMGSFYLLFESMICFIQAYVFTLLNTEYLSDHSISNK